MRGSAGPIQEDCSYCLVKFDGRNKTCGCEFYMCRSKICKAIQEPFTCPHCLQRPDVHAHLANPPPSQPLQVNIPDGTGQSSGLTEGIKYMNVSDPVRKAPEPSAKTVLQDIRAAQYQVLKFISKASRTNFALVLSGTITKIISNPSDVDNWRRFLLMPKICLKAPPYAGQQKTSLATLENRQIGNFCQNADLRSLVGAHKARKFSKKKKGSARPNLIYSKIDAGKVRGAVRIASSGAVWSRLRSVVFLSEIVNGFSVKVIFGRPSNFCTFCLY